MIRVGHGPGCGSSFVRRSVLEYSASGEAGRCVNLVRDGKLLGPAELLIIGLICIGLIGLPLTAVIVVLVVLNKKKRQSRNAAASQKPGDDANPGRRLSGDG